MQFERRLHFGFVSHAKDVPAELARPTTAQIWQNKLARRWYAWDLVDSKQGAHGKANY